MYGIVLATNMFAVILITVIITVIKEFTDLIKESVKDMRKDATIKVSTLKSITNRISKTNLLIIILITIITVVSESSKYSENIVWFTWKI